MFSSNKSEQNSERLHCVRDGMGLEYSSRLRRSGIVVEQESFFFNLNKRRRGQQRSYTRRQIIQKKLLNKTEVEVYQFFANQELLLERSQNIRTRSGVRFKNPDSTHLCFATHCFGVGPVRCEMKFENSRFIKLLFMITNHQNF